MKRALALAAALVLARAFLFIVFEEAQLDADQAVYGLMAKHLASLQAFPLYAYGQRYMLAVSVWLAAPFVALFGCHVWAIKLPLLFINLAVAGLLVTRLARETGLAPLTALAVSLPFVFPPVGAAARLLEHAGGNVEPFLWISLLWILRYRPIPFGLVAGVGFLNREFTAYGIAGVLLVEAIEGRLLTRGSLRAKLRAGLAFAAVAALVHFLAPFSTNAFGLAPQVRWKGWPGVLGRLGALITLLPSLYGVRSTPLSAFTVESRLMVGWSVAALPAVVVLAAVAVRAGLRFRDRPPLREIVLPLYLASVGALAVAAYALLGRGGGDPTYLRYLLLALLFPIGLFALFFRLEPRRGWRVGAMAALLVWAASSAADQARVLTEYARRPPPHAFRTLAEHLEKRGIAYGVADYWTAYPVTFLSSERVRLASSSLNRIPEYETLFEGHRDQAVRILEPPCQAGTKVAGWCVVGPPAPPGPPTARPPEEP